MGKASNKGFGLVRAVFLVIGNTIGSGILLLPASLGKFGSIGLLGWILTTIGALFLALTFSRLARTAPGVGGPYSYSRLAFGDFIGFQMAWSYWIATWISTAAVLYACISYLSFFFPLLSQSPHLGTFIAIILLWVITFINTFGIKEAAILQVFLTLLKLLPIILIPLSGMFFLKVEHFFPINLTGESHFTALTMAASLTLFSFIGIESATIPIEDVEDPQKTIPRATIIGTSVAAVIYIFITAVLMGVLPPKVLGASHAPFADAALVIFGEVLGPILSAVIAVGAILTCIGTAHGWILLQGQVPYTAAVNNLLPQIFRKRSKKNVPLFGLYLSSILMTLFMLLNLSESLIDTFNKIILVSTLLFIFPYAYASISSIVLQLKSDQPINKGGFSRALFIALVSFGFCLWCIQGCGAEVVFYGTFYILIGVPIYALMKRT